MRVRKPEAIELAGSASGFPTEGKTELSMFAWHWDVSTAWFSSARATADGTWCSESPSPNENLSLVRSAHYRRATVAAGAFFGGGLSMKTSAAATKERMAAVRKAPTNPPVESLIMPVTGGAMMEAVP